MRDGTSRVRRRSPNGFSIVELLLLVVVTGLLLGLTVPILQGVSCDALKAASASNLVALGTAHATYAADWNDRQFTLVRDRLGFFNGDCQDFYENAGCHPPIILGADCDGVDRGYLLGCDESGPDCDGFWRLSPINFTSSGPTEGQGSFRLPNARGFHEYVNGKFFDPTFYAPKDTVVLDLVAPLFDEPCEFVNVDESLVFSASYILSPAAMYDPAVFNPNDFDDPELNGWQDPDWLDEGFRSPPVSQALYASQKTRMLEHHWLQRPAEPCNPGFDGPYDGCQPYFFNHAKRSNPVTLFYDGHVRGLSTLEAMISDDRVRRQTDGIEGLWSRDTPLGQNGYYIEYGYDTTQTSYHILTTRGIRGRDTVK